jgi:hypothetical protein
MNLARVLLSFKGGGVMAQWTAASHANGAIIDD